MTEEKKFSERVKDKYQKKSETKTIPITFPTEVYAQFKEYAFENAAGCYWLAIKDWLNEEEHKKQFNALADQYDIVMSKVVELEEQIASLKESPNKKYNSFGKEDKE